MIKEKGAALVVTYNRIEKLEECIKCLLDQTSMLDKIYVVNNASKDGTETYLKEIARKHTQIRYMNNKENLGGAGGFAKGIEWAIEEGADWVWGMDDDAFPQPEALEKLLKEREKNGRGNAFWSNCNRDEKFDDDVKSVQEWMFVGFFLPKEIIKAVGLPRADFYIYYDDFEYADRIIKSGFQILKVRDSIIRHSDATSNEKKWYIGKKQVEILLLPEQKWKTYYLTRNELLRYSKKDARYISAVMRNMRRIIKAMLYSRNQLGAVLKGFYHGLIGKAGKVMAP